MTKNHTSNDKTAQLQQLEEQVQYDLKGKYEPGSRLQHLQIAFAAGAILSFLYFSWRMVFCIEDIVNNAITARLASLSLAIIFGSIALMIAPKARQASTTKASDELLALISRTDFSAKLALDRLILSLQTKGSVTIAEVQTLIDCERDQHALDQDGAAKLIALGAPDFATVLGHSKNGDQKIDYSSALK